MRVRGLARSPRGLGAQFGDRLQRVVVRDATLEHRQQNTPTALTGQLIVFETLSALGYAYIVYARAPSVLEMAGIALLVFGVIVGVRALSSRS